MCMYTVVNAIGSMFFVLPKILTVPPVAVWYVNGPLTGPFVRLVWLGSN